MRFVQDLYPKIKVAIVSYRQESLLVSSCSTTNAMILIQHGVNRRERMVEMTHRMFQDVPTLYFQNLPLKFVWNKMQQHIMKRYRPEISYPVVGNPKHNALVNTCTLTATITGTVGRAGIMIGKPAILFGDFSWYERCPGTFKVTGIKDCKEAVAKALQRTPDQVKTDMNTFIQEQRSYFIKGLNSYEAVKKSGLNLEEVAGNMVSNVVAYATC